MVSCCPLWGQRKHSSFLSSHWPLAAFSFSLKRQKFRVAKKPHDTFFPHFNRLILFKLKAHSLICTSLSNLSSSSSCAAGLSPYNLSATSPAVQKNGGGRRGWVLRLPLPCNLLGLAQTGAPSNPSCSSAHTLTHLQFASGLGKHSCRCQSLGHTQIRKELHATGRQ